MRVKGTKICRTKMVFFFLIWSIPVIFAIDQVTVDLLTPAKQFGEACGYDSCAPLREGALNVHIVPHTHGELGFTGDFYSHFTGDFGDVHAKTQVNMKRILDYTITELWADNERKFVLSDMAYFFYWWKQRDETVHRMVYELLRQGRLQFVGGGFSMCDEATTSYHAVIDSFTYSLQRINATFLECGRPLVSWQSDVFGHSREFASLMSQMGFGGHFINPISYDDEVVRMISKSMEFVWRGSDDLGPYTDLYTHKLFDGYWSPPGFCFGTYCEDQPIIEAHEGFKNVEQRVQEFIESALHRQGPYYTTQNIMIIMGQRFGYFDAGAWFSNIDKLIRNVNTKSAGSGVPLNLFYSSPACYLKAVYRANPELPTKQDDFLPFAYDQHSMAVGMYTARPTFKYFIRQGHVYLQIAKQLQLTARLHTKYYDSILERLKWINSIVQDHNIITGVMAEHSRLYYTHKMHLALQGSTTLDAAAINKLRKSPDDTEYFRCSFNISLCQNTDVEQYFIVVYNPLAWPVTVRVRLPTLKRGFIVYHHSGKRVRAALMRIAEPVFATYRHHTHAKHDLVFIAEEIPPMGYRSYFIKLRSRREKRAILKKVNKKHKTKKYLVKQAYQNGLMEDNPEDFGTFDYEYFEGPVRTTPQTKILFGNVENDSEQDISSDDVITPRTRLRIGDDDDLSDNNKIKVDLKSELTDVTSNSQESKLTDNNFKLKKNKTMERDSRRGNLGKNFVNVNKTPDSYQNNTHTNKNKDNTLNTNKDLSIEPRKNNNTREIERIIYMNDINSTTVSDDDEEIELIRKYYNEDDNNIKNIVATVSATTEKDIFSEEDTKPDIIVGPKNMFNKKKIDYIPLKDDMPLKEIEEAEEMLPTKDIFSELDSEPDIILGPKNIYNKNNKVNEDKLARVENKLKEKEYAELGLSDSNENTNVTNKKIPFEDDDDFFINGKFKKPANKTLNKDKWLTDDMTNKNIAAARKMLADHLSQSDLKDSDFSDMKTGSDEGKAGKNGSRKFTIFGSDDEQMRKQMFAAGTETEKSGEYEKLGKIKFKSDDEKDKAISGTDDEKPRKPGSKNEKSNKANTASDVEIPFDRPITKMILTEQDKKKIRILSALANGTRKALNTDAGLTGEIGEPWDGYDYYSTNDLYINNSYIRISLDKQKKLTKITLSNGINITFSAGMFYYVSDDPKKFNRDERQPGIAMFRAMDPRALLINDVFRVNVYKNRIVQELHYEFADYASFVMRLYKRDPIIEVEWQVGPVPIADDMGKEIFIRYTTDLQHSGTFYTDSNGRQTVKRVRNRRASYEPMNLDTLAGNIYPVTSKIYIEDVNRNIRFSVFNDRPQGGTSLADGEIDLFLHRRILTDDTGRGFLNLNETENGKGIIVRGKHYLYLTRADSKPNRIFEKKLAKEIELAPQIFVTQGEPYGLNSKLIWSQQKNEYTALKTVLPIGVHILTLEKWGENGDELLLRLENYLERTDTLKKGIKKITLKDFFFDISITSIKELSLGANMWRSHATSEKFFWNKKNEFFKSFNQAYGDGAEKEVDNRKPKTFFEKVSLDDDIMLVPQQIRTFFVTYEYIGD